MKSKVSPRPRSPVDEQEQLRLSILATQQRTLRATEALAREAISEVEDSERKHMARVMKTGACAAESITPTKSLKRRPASSMGSDSSDMEVLRRLRAKMDAEIAAERNAKRSVSRTKAATPNPMSRVEMRAALYDAAHAASMVVSKHVREFNETHLSLAHEVTDDIMARRSEYLEATFSASSSQRDPQRKARHIRDETIAQQNRLRRQSAKARTDALQQAIIDSKVQAQRRREFSLNPIEHTNATSTESDAFVLERQRTGLASIVVAEAITAQCSDAINPGDAVAQREAELMAHRQAVMIASLDRQRTELAEHVIAKTIFAALRQNKSERDAQEREAKQQQEQQRNKQRKLAREQQKERHANRLKLQAQFADAQAEALSKYQKHSASPTSPNRYIDHQWVEDMERHREVVVMRKRDAEEDELRQAQERVKHHVAATGAGSQQVVETTEKMQERRELIAARRRREALDASWAREQARLARIDAAHQRATEVEEESLHLLSDVVRREAMEQLQKRLRVEEMRARELKVSSEYRLHCSVFTPLEDPSYHYRSFVDSEFRHLHGEAPSQPPVKWQSYLHFVASMAHLPDAMSHFPHAHSSATFDESTGLGLLLDAAKEDHPPSAQVCATHLVLSAWRDARVFKSVSPWARETAVGCALSSFGAEGSFDDGHGLRLLLKVADEVHDTRNRAAAATHSPLGVVLQTLMEDHADTSDAIDVVLSTSPKSQQRQRLPRTVTPAAMNASTRVMPETLMTPPRSLSDFPTDHAISVARRTHTAKPHVIAAAERLVTLLREQEELIRAKHLKDGDPIEIRRDRAKAAAEASKRLIKEPSARLTRLSVMQEAQRAGIPAQMHAEATSVSAQSGETMMSRHLAHDAMEGCSPRLYDPKKMEDAKQRSIQRQMIRASEEEEARAAIHKPLTPAGHKLIERVYTAPVRRAKDRMANLLKAEEMRFDEVTLASKKLELSEQEVIAISTRLAARPLSRTARKSSPRSPTKSNSPTPHLSKEAVVELSQRLHAAAVAQQLAESERLTQAYMSKGRTIKLTPLDQKESVERLYTSGRPS